MDKKHKKIRPYEKLPRFAAAFTGTTKAFIIACLVILIWQFLGSLFHFSDTWHLVTNRGTTIITFLMVLIIQRMQNKDYQVIYFKLNELSASPKGPGNRLVDVED